MNQHSDVSADLNTLNELTQVAETQINTDIEDQQRYNTQMLQTYYDNIMLGDGMSSSDNTDPSTRGMSSSEMSVSSTLLKNYLDSSGPSLDEKLTFIKKYFGWNPEKLDTTFNSMDEAAKMWGQNGEYSGNCDPNNVDIEYTYTPGWGKWMCLNHTLKKVWEDAKVTDWLIDKALPQQDHTNMCPMSRPLLINKVCYNQDVDGKQTPPSPAGSSSLKAFQAFPDIKGDDYSLINAKSPLTQEFSWKNLDTDLKKSFINNSSEQLFSEKDPNWDKSKSMQHFKNLLDEKKTNITTQLDNMKKYQQIRNTILENSPDQAVSSYNLAEAQIDDLTDKQITSSIMKGESDNIESNIDALQDLGINKVRSAEINTYYAEQYREQIKITKLLILAGILILIFTILMKQGILPQSIANILIAIVIVIGCYYIGGKVYNYYRRNNMNFQEFDYSDDVHVSHERKDNEGSMWEDDKKQLKKIDVLDKRWFGECKGAECCGPNQTYDINKDLCMDEPKIDEPLDREKFNM